MLLRHELKLRSESRQQSLLCDLIIYQPSEFFFHWPLEDMNKEIEYVLYMYQLKSSHACFSGIWH
jgi:hypothetical protein